MGLLKTELFLAKKQNEQQQQFPTGTYHTSRKVQRELLLSKKYAFKKSPHIGFSNLDFPWLSMSQFAWTFPAMIFFLPEIRGAVFGDAFGKASKNMLYWRW